jgi:hypothetical protein
MASVHRDNRGKTPYWIGAFTDEFGRRRKRSTETTDKRQAKTIVEGWQKAVDEAKGGRLTEIKARQIVNEILERTTGRKFKTGPRVITEKSSLTAFTSLFLPTQCKLHRTYEHMTAHDGSSLSKL